MTENKRFTLKNWNDYAEGDCIYYDNGEEMGSLDVLDTLNSLSKDNEQLKNELRVYRKLANCRNCQYHNYDTLFGGDEEYEICDKGNDVTDGICKDWREL